MSKKLKILLLSVAGIVTVIVIIILFISPITKYLIEKYDEKYTGRQITMDWAYVNPFTGYVHLENLIIHELKSDSVFFTSKGVSATFTIYKLLSGNYEIKDLSFDHPWGIVTQDKRSFNFTDLVKLFYPEENKLIERIPVHFSILKLKINSGEFHFRENSIPVNYFIKDVELNSTGIQWDTDTVSSEFSFRSGMATGKVKGDFTINLKSNNYRFAAIVEHFDLNIIGQYLKEITNYGTFSANLDADIKATGNFNDAQDITAKGFLSINEFHFGKNPKDDYASFEKLVINIKELSPIKQAYLFDTVLLSHPFFKYEQYDHLDNLQTIFGVNGANYIEAENDLYRFNLVVEMAHYIKLIARNIFQSYYTINRLDILKGELKYNDFSLSEKFALELNPFTITADSISQKRKWAYIYMKSAFKPYGQMLVDLKINPKDSSDFDLNYTLQKFPVTVFNPYVINYTSYPFDRGTIEMNGAWNVRKGIISSTNNLLIIDPRMAQRMKKKDAHWIPMPIVMALVRERGNVIDYEIPITGDLKNSKFHFKDVVIDLLKNIFVKPVTTTYRLQVKKIENEIEKSHSLTWSFTKSSFTNNQQNFIKDMVKFLEKNKNASISIYPQNYELKEKEYLFFFEAKKKYFLFSNHKNNADFDDEDSAKVEKMSVKDPGFIEYLHHQVNDSLLFTVQDKCYRLIDSKLINIKLSQLNSSRKNSFLSFFANGDVQNRVKVFPAVNIIPYNGFSFYKIAYDGEIPKSLIKAYRKINDLNERSPRNKIKNKRMRSSQMSNN